MFLPGFDLRSSDLLKVVNSALATFRPSSWFVFSTFNYLQGTDHSSSIDVCVPSTVYRLLRSSRYPPKMDGQSQTVRITYHQPGTKPPIFVAGSFTTPPWEPRELQYTKTTPGPGETVAEEAGDSDLEFFDDFKVGDGQYQYKFRIGHGDWWVCDESVETGGFFSSPFH